MPEPSPRYGHSSGGLSAHQPTVESTSRVILTDDCGATVIRSVLLLSIGSILCILSVVQGRWTVNIPQPDTNGPYLQIYNECLSQVRVPENLHVHNIHVW